MEELDSSCDISLRHFLAILHHPSPSPTSERLSESRLRRVVAGKPGCQRLRLFAGRTVALCVGYRGAPGRQPGRRDRVSGTTSGVWQVSSVCPGQNGAFENGIRVRHSAGREKSLCLAAAPRFHRIPSIQGPTCHFQSYLAQFFRAIWRSVRFRSGVYDCLLRVVSHIRAFRLIDLLNPPRRFELFANRGSHHLAILPSENYARDRSKLQAIPALQSELRTSGELWRMRGDGPSDSIAARIRLCILAPAL